MLDHDRVDVERLVSRCTDVLQAAGVPDGRAERLAELFVRAEAEGAVSHGVSRIPLLVERIRVGVVDPAADPVVLREGGAVTVLDANHGLGQIVADQAMAAAVDKAATFGVGVVAVRNTSHLGRAGHVARSAAEVGMVGVALTNASPRLLPEPGGRPILGNNPWAVAWPTAEGPVCVDMANSVVAAGKIRAAAARGEPIPEDWATTAEGEATTDPHAALRGALLAFGGHKGWSLSLVVDVLTGGLADGAMGDEVAPVDDLSRSQRVSSTFAALNVEFFCDPQLFAERQQRFGRRLREVTGPEARLPGERSDTLLNHNREHGVPVHQSTLRALADLEASSGL